MASVDAGGQGTPATPNSGNISVMSSNPIRASALGMEVHFDEKPIRGIISDLLVQTANEVESEHLEIKDWCSSERELAEKIAEACVCIANAEGGHVLVGVNDDATDYHKFSACPHSAVNTAWIQAKIHDLTKPPVEIYPFDATRVLAELRQVGGANLFAIRVPRTHFINGHITNKGISKVRVGKECRPQYTAEDDRTNVIAPGVSIDGLSISSIEWAMAQHKSNSKVALTWASKQEFLEHERLVISHPPDEDCLGGVQVTVAALLLFGKTTSLEKPSAPFLETLVMVDGETNPIRIRKNIIDSVRDLCIGHSSILRTRLPQIRSDVLKELVVNAYIHRCYRTPSPIMIRISTNSELEVRSPGPLLNGLSVRNLIHGAPIYRNLLLASGARFAGLCDKMGNGIDLIFEGLLSEGLALPEFESNENFTARVPVAGSAEFKQFLRARGAILGELDEVIALRVLWSRDSATVDELCNVMQRNIDFGQRVLDRMCKKNMTEADYDGYRLTAVVRHDIETIFQAPQLSFDDLL